jgi:Ca-activated chloride channel family protein
MKIEAALTYEKIRHDQEKAAHLVITLLAPTKTGEDTRPPICVVPVIDISGSMSGGKLEYAKRSALKLIDHLRPGDYTGLIAFESQVEVIIPPQKVTAETKDKLKAEVGKLTPRGGTNFSGGMLKAIELVQALDLPDGVLNRVIMLTDGQPNEGVAKSPADIIRALTANAGRVTTSAFGFGNDVDQNFLGDFAKEGKGNYAFIKDPDGALAAFGKELGGLLSTYATDIQLEVEGLAGHEITSVVSDVDAEQEAIGGEVTIKVPELLTEERRDLTLAVKLKESKQAFPRAVNVFDIKLSYSTIASDGKKEQHTEEAKAKVHFVKPGEEDSKPVAALDKLVALAELVRAQIEAEEKVKRGDYKGAAVQMDFMAVDMERRGHHNLRAAACKTAGSVGSAHSYSANQGYLRSFREGGTRGMGLVASEDSAQVFLADAGVNFSNSVQSSTSSSFTGGGAVVDVAAPLIPTSPPGVAALPVDSAGSIGWGGVVQPLTANPAGEVPIGAGASWTGSSVGHNPILVSPASPLIPQASSAEPEAPKAPRKAIKKSKSTRW